jgi:hypothetical protein
MLQDYIFPLLSLVRANNVFGNSHYSKSYINLNAQILKSDLAVALFCQNAIAEEIKVCYNKENKQNI